MDNIEIEKEIIAEKKSISYLRRFFIIAFLLIAACLGTFYYTTTQHQGNQMVEASVFEARLQNLENAIPLHQERIEKLEAAAKQAASTTPSSSVTVTSAGPQAAGTAAPAGDASDRLSALEKEVKALKPSPIGGTPEQTAAAITLLSAFHRLSDNMLGGRPFASQLSAFQENFGNDDKALNDVISTITPYAAGGVPTIYRLLQSFDKAHDALKASGTTSATTGTFSDKLSSNLSQMVTVRRTDKAPVGDSPEAVLARAESDLDNEEVEAAIAEVKSLPDNARAPFDNWLEDAQMSSLAPSIVDQIEEKTMKKAFAQDATAASKP